MGGIIRPSALALVRYKHCYHYIILPATRQGVPGKNKGKLVIHFYYRDSEENRNYPVVFATAAPTTIPLDSRRMNKVPTPLNTAVKYLSVLSWSILPLCMILFKLIKSSSRVEHLWWRHYVMQHGAKRGEWISVLLHNLLALLVQIFKDMKHLKITPQQANYQRMHWGNSLLPGETIKTSLHSSLLRKTCLYFYIQKSFWINVFWVFI